MRISAHVSVKQPAWSGTLADVQQLARRVETLIAPAVDAAEKEAAARVEAKYSYLEPHLLKERVEAAIADTRAALKLTVELQYREYSAKHRGTVEELADMDVYGLKGLTVACGRGAFDDRLRITITMDAAKVEAEIKANDTGFLAGARAELAGQLARNKPGWWFVRSRWAMVLVAVAWVGLSAWWCLRLVDPVAESVIVLPWVGIVPLPGLLSLVPLLRDRWFPAFEPLEENRDGPVRRRIHRIGLLLSLVLAILGALPVFL